MANDTHLPLSMPSVWNYVQIRSPKYQAAGVSIAGLPGVVAGFNGKLAWGMTMVLGDNQDLYLEQLRRQGNRLYYLADGKWQPTRERQETFFIKGQRPIREVIHETRHGPLLNSALGERKNILQPLPLKSGYGLAYRSIQQEADKTLDGFFDLSRAKTIEQAFDATREIRAMPLNIVFADESTSAGRSPDAIRTARKVVACCPPLAGTAATTGMAMPTRSSTRPTRTRSRSWLGTANHRTVQPGYGAQLSNSWYYPERAERIAQLAGASKSHDTQSMIRMQYDQTSLFVAKLQAMFDNPGMALPLRRAIDALPEAQRSRAREAYDRLMAFDGKLTASSSDAALYGAFLHERQADIPRRARTGGRPCLESLRRDRQPLLLGASRPPARARRQSVLGRYPHSAEGGQTGNPRAQPRRRRGVLRTATGERAQGLAMGQAAHLRMAERQLENGPYLGAGERAGLGAIKGYLDRGPYPAGGDHHAGRIGLRLGPGLRHLADPGDAADRRLRPERTDDRREQQRPIRQSGQPALRRRYRRLAQGRYVSFPFQPQNLDRVYGNKRLTLTPAR